MKYGYPSELRSFFERYLQGDYELLVTRAVNALNRANIYTMAELDAMTEEQIQRLRNVGATTKDFITNIALADYRKENPQVFVDTK